MNTYFADGREFALIESLFGDNHFARDGEGLGDDGFLLRSDAGTLVISTDSSVEGVHFRGDWVTPARAARKALLSNLSDINAMGATCSHAFLNLGVPDHWNLDALRELGEAIKEMERHYGFRISGGDTVRSGGAAFLAFTVLGRLQGNPLLRSNARPGHKVYVSGRLGGSAAGLQALLSGRGADPQTAAFVEVHLEPAPPLALGPALALVPGPVAAIDISDGLSSELWHLSRQSQCRLVIDPGRLPRAHGLETGAAEGRWMDWVLHGGEEYQLLFTGDLPGNVLDMLRKITEIQEIGFAREGAGVGFLNAAGAESELLPKGWSH